MQTLTPEQENAALRAEIAGFTSHDIASRGVDEKQAGVFYIRASKAFNKRAQIQNQVREAILKSLPAAA